MNEEQLQQAFILFLAQKTGAKSQEELEAAIQLMGEEGLQQAYAEFMQLIQQQQAQKLKHGAKLNYIRQLRGQCPEGYEPQYFKRGGRVCKTCKPQQVTMEQGGVTPTDAIDAFRCGRKTKKPKAACGSKVQEAKCGSKTKKPKKACGGASIPFLKRGLK